MSIPLRTRMCESHVVVALHGDLDVVDADGAAAAVAACGPRVIVDLSALEFADCYALGALLRVQQAARAAGGGVRLAAPPGTAAPSGTATGDGCGAGCAGG